MLEALRRWQDENPDLRRALAIANLPKEVRGEKNGNWRGGRTAEKRGFYMAHYSDIQKWRAAVLSRDGHRCKNCGRDEHLECHHIIPVSMTKAFAFERANGVTLCKECHTETDSYGGRNITPVANGLAIIATIPHHWQDYPTVGNWFVGKHGEPTVGILVSAMRDHRYNFLVALHELIESALCAHAGIKQSVVDKFDTEWKPHDGIEEPGSDPAAPYYREHFIATAIEMQMAHWLDVDWKAYGEALDEL